MLDQGRLRAQVMLLKAIAHECRYEILRILLEGERNVSQIVEEVGQPQPTVSHHLACLRNCGLVKTRRVGKEVFYVVHGKERIQTLMEIVRTQVEEALEGVLSCEVLSKGAPPRRVLRVRS